MQILLIGCGNMGSGMLSAWLDAGLITRAVIVDHDAPHITQQFTAHQHLLSVHADATALPQSLSPDLVILAVKPQQMAAVLTDLAPRLKPEWPVMTIAAGLRQEFYVRHLPENPIIRVMPNTPAIARKGMTVATTRHALPPTIKHQIETLLRATGDFFWVDSEDQLDAAMAISGSGPAYFFYLAEQLAKAGSAHGISPEQSLRLARQTLIGTGAMAEIQTAKSITQLRQDVTSPGGVTTAAIAAWEQNNVFADLIARGITANIARGQELAKL